jgi:FkbM family methyltransferase
MKSGKTTIRMVGDVMVSVPDNGRLMTPYVLYEQEDWFEDEIRFLRKISRPGMQMIDVGANYGLYTLALAQVLGESGRVLAVEPSSATASHLRESVTINRFGQISIAQVALSDRIGNARLQLSDNAELNALAVEYSPGTTTEDVSLTTLDKLVEDHGCRDVDFLKVDAEGEEERILAGGKRFFLDQSPLVMYEIKSGDKLNLGLVDAFAAMGYASYRLVPGLGMLAPFDPNDGLEAYQLNLFCCKQDRAMALARDGILAMAKNIPESVSASDHWWRQELVTWPFAASMQADWFTEESISRQTGSDYGAIVSLYGAAHDSARDPATRYAALRIAYEGLTALCRTDRDPYRLSTLARVAREFGARRVAVFIIGKAIQSLTQDDPGPPGQPFLPASEHFDRVVASGRLRSWLLASLLDQGISLYAHSTYFAPLELLQNLEALKSTGFQRPEMERRRQLMRIRANLQARPEPDPSLVKYDAGNRNPGFWTGQTVFS